jgi:hypothetical protein
MWPFGKSAAVQVTSRDELLPVCNGLIERGKFINALSVAEEYKRYALSTTSPSPAEEAVSVAYAYHMIAKATFHLITRGASGQTYKNYMTFFFAYMMCRACLQAGQGVGRYSPGYDAISQERDQYYDELYRRCDGDPKLERADTDANQRVSEMMDASPFFWA